MKDKKPEYAVMLCFDVKIDPDARKEAQLLNIKIFEANIIYHLFDQFDKYINEYREMKKQEAKKKAVFPCILKIDPNNIFRKSDPIILGVSILKGVLYEGTPIIIQKNNEFLLLGIIESIERNKKTVNKVRDGDVAIKIVPKGTVYSYDRHFNHENQLISKIDRDSIDALKE